MKRGGFFKSLLVLVAAPSIVKDIDFEANVDVPKSEPKTPKTFTINVYGIEDIDVKRWKQIKK